MQKILYIISILFILIFSSHLYGQLEGYGSVTIGYHNNPLYNYQKLGDQIKQTYLEIKGSKDYANSTLGFSYVSGLMMFNQFEERNFYEHTFATNYQIKIFNEKKKENVDTLSADGEESEENQSDADSIQTEEDNPNYNSLIFGLSLGARHDKEIHQEFNNYGLTFTTTYKQEENPNFLFNLENSLSYRNYTYISELSNLTDVFSFQIGKKQEIGFNYGLKISAGLKYYAQTAYDTTRFEIIRSFVVKGAGKGKPGSKVYSQKQILIQPQSNGSYQLILDMSVGHNWTSTTIQTDFLYRYNPRSEIRYLAQYVNTTFLSEDIYNDFFSHEGPEATLKFTQKLPLNIQFKLDTEFLYKKFKAPALSLLGEQVAEKRIDLRTSLEITLSRYFDIGAGLGIDLSFNVGLMRNQSNDNYNDYSSNFISLGIGIGF